MGKAKLTLTPVAELPKRQRTSPYTVLVEEFVKGGAAHAKVENAPKNSATSLRAAVQKLGVSDQVEVKTIAGGVYLTRR